MPLLSSEEHAKQKTYTNCEMHIRANRHLVLFFAATDTLRDYRRVIARQSPIGDRVNRIRRAGNTTNRLPMRSSPP